MKKSVSTAYGLLKQAHQQKKVYCEVNNSKQTILYLRALRQNSLIYGYSLIPETNKIFVYLRYYRNRPTLKHLRLYSKQGHRRSVNKKNIFTINNIANPANVALVGTSKSSTLEQLYFFKNDNKLVYSNKYFGELISMVW